MGRLAVHTQHRICAFSEAQAEKGCCEISDCFIMRSDRVLLRNRAVTKSSNLREDEPHPVGLLAAGFEFGKRRVNRLLRRNETLEIEATGGWWGRHKLVLCA